MDNNEIMFCTKCGQQVNSTMDTCPNCAERLNEPPMKWFKFLIYFSLWASAVLNVINAISLLFGLQYGDLADVIYTSYPGLQPFELALGVFSLVLAVTAICARFALARYKKNGPALLNTIYILLLINHAVYLLGMWAILPANIFATLDISSIISSVISAVFYLIVNTIYFKKRAHMFVN